LTREDLIKNVMKLGLTKNQAAQSVDTFFSAIVSALKKEQTVSIVGFGSWEWKKRIARLARNPKTGKVVSLGARRALLFKPSGKIKKKLKG
jgi:nucleoid DNA-binding protein